MELKRGDRVRLIKDNSNLVNFGVTIGSEGVVEYDCSDDPCCAFRDDKGILWYSETDCLELVTAPTVSEDTINHPDHYARWKMEPIEFIAINDLPWWLANVIKYTMRFDAKDGLKDLYKARSYLDMKIRDEEGVEKFWEKPVAEERKLNAG